MRAARLAVALAAALAVGTPAQALADDLPAGKLGVGAGGRFGVGALGAEFGTGTMLTIEAGYHPQRPGRTLSMGLNWSLASSWFGFDDTASLSGSLRLLEFSFGLRMRRVLGRVTDRFVFVGVGGTLLRSNVPLEPDGKRDYAGPYASVGAEGWVSSYLLGIEFRYGLLSGGPSSLSMILSIGVGA